MCHRQHHRAPLQLTDKPAANTLTCSSQFVVPLSGVLLYAHALKYPTTIGIMPRKHTQTQTRAHYCTYYSYCVTLLAFVVVALVITTIANMPPPVFRPECTRIMAARNERVHTTSVKELVDQFSAAVVPLALLCLLYNASSFCCTFRTWLACGRTCLPKSHSVH